MIGIVIRMTCVAAVTLMAMPFLAAWADSSPARVSASPQYNLYFGDLHSHTTYSDAWEGTPWDAFAAGKAAGADFMAVTDHSYYMTDEQWEDLKAAAESFTSDTFVGIPGYEYWMTSCGEVNVFNVPDLPPWPTVPFAKGVPGHRGSHWDLLPRFYDWLADKDGGVAQWNHPLYVSRDFLDYSYYTDSRDTGMGLIEVYNAEDYEESYLKALDAGWHIMPSANSDTHSPDWISGHEMRTVLLADALTADDLYEAMAEGRGYATLDRNLRVEYTLDGAVMGSNLSDPDGPHTAWIRVVDPDGSPEDEITLVEVVSDGGLVAATVSTSGTEVELTIHLDPADARYYYVRITTASPLNGEPGVTAWTAPIWTGA